MRLELRDVQPRLRRRHAVRGRGVAWRLANGRAGRGARHRRRYGFGQEHARAAHEFAARPVERRGARRRRGREDVEEERAAAQGRARLPVPRSGAFRPHRRGGRGLRPAPARVGRGGGQGTRAGVAAGCSGSGTWRGARRSRYPAARSGGSPSPGCSRWGPRCSYSTSPRRASTPPPGGSCWP